MLIIYLSFFLASAQVNNFYGTTLNIFKNYVNTTQLAISFLDQVHEETDKHEETFKKYLSLLEKVDDLYDQQEKLLIFNDANIEYVLKKTRKNYNEKLQQIAINMDKNQDQLEKLEKNLQINTDAQQKTISELKDITNLIQEVLKDNFSVNYQKLIPILNDKIAQDYFQQFQKLKTLDYQLLTKELEKYQNFIQQQTIKESKKKDLANCYSLISSVLKQALILMISEQQQQQFETSMKILILREDNKQLAQQLQQIKRLKRLFEDSQEFKITLMKQYRENIKFIQFKKKQFREMARKIIEVNEEKTKSYINDENLIYFYYIATVILYALTSLGFLFKPFNRAQRALSYVFRQQPIYNIINLTLWGFCLIICIFWIYTFDEIKRQVAHLEMHIDRTSLDYIEDKEDIFRDERNLYLYGGALFASLANVRFLRLIHDYYESQERVEVLQKKLKKE